MTNVCKNTQGNTPIKIYVLHGYTDGLTDPIVSTDYEEVYAAMKAAYESALDGVEQEDSDREYSFLEGWSATAVVHGDWMEWQIAELELKVPEEQPGSVKNFVALVKNGSFLVRITDMTILIEKEFIYGSSKRPNPTDYYRKQHYQCG